jgi:hypothetical protein
MSRGIPNTYGVPNAPSLHIASSRLLGDIFNPRGAPFIWPEKGGFLRVLPRRHNPDKIHAGYHVAEEFTYLRGAKSS